MHSSFLYSVLTTRVFDEIFKRDIYNLDRQIAVFIDTYIRPANKFKYKEELFYLGSTQVNLIGIAHGVPTGKTQLLVLDQWGFHHIYQQYIQLKQECTYVRNYLKAVSNMCRRVDDVNLFLPNSLHATILKGFIPQEPTIDINSEDCQKVLKRFSSANTLINKKQLENILAKEE